MTMQLIPGYFGPRVQAKLAKMRKERDWSVQPTDQEGQMIVQADGAIGQFDFRTREGVLNTRGEYFVHLSRLGGAQPYTFPDEFVRLCLEACPSLDGETSRGGVTIMHTVHTIGGAV